MCSPGKDLCWQCKSGHSIIAPLGVLGNLQHSGRTRAGCNWEGKPHHLELDFHMTVVSWWNQHRAAPHGPVSCTVNQTFGHRANREVGLKHENIFYVAKHTVETLKKKMSLRRLLETVTSHLLCASASSHTEAHWQHFGSQSKQIYVSKSLSQRGYVLIWHMAS